MHAEWLILYTAQKQKKSKTWQDGKLRIEPGGFVRLLTDSGDSLERHRLASASLQVTAGFEFETARHLVQVEGPLGGAQPTVVEQPPPKRIKQLQPKEKLTDEQLLAFLDSSTLPSSADRGPKLSAFVTAKEASSCAIDMTLTEPPQTSRSLQLAAVFASTAEYRKAYSGALLEFIRVVAAKVVPKTPVQSIRVSQFPCKEPFFLPKKFLLRLNEGATKHAHSKDDLWILRRDREHLIAVSSFHGPTSDGEVEVKIFSSFASCGLLSNCSGALAGVSSDATSELLALSLLQHPEFSWHREFEAVLLGRPIKVPPLLKGNGISRNVEEFASRYSLNAQQLGVLFRFDALLFGGSGDSPCFVIHGVFGSGKSFVIALLAVYAAQFKKGPRLLIASNTNVAVDRVLGCLLQVGYEDFMRVGSLRRIARNILPYAMQSLRSDDEIRELLEMQKNEPMTDSEKADVSRAIANCRKRENSRVIKEARVIGSTCAATTFDVFNDCVLPVVILDECSQQTEPMSLLATRFGCRRLVLVGDPMQLPPTVPVPCAVDRKVSLERTLFDRMVSTGTDSMRLFTQYRCHSSISRIVSDLFYASQIVDGSPNSVEERVLEFIDVSAGRDEERNCSLVNVAEAKAIVQLVAKIPAEDRGSIGVISFYRSQVFLLRELLPQYMAANVATVDSFQGGERDTIIVNLVKTRDSVNSGTDQFIECPLRVNVALTRARKRLFVVGNSARLQKSNLWRKILRYFE